MPAEPTKKRKRGHLAAVLAVTAVIALVGGFFFGRALWWSLRPTPEFGSLAAQPDAALRGTVAFIRPFPDNGCVWVVAASGAKPKKVACVDGGAGELEWLPDGRIQSTRYQSGEGTSDTRSWVVDVATGAVEEVPLDQIPPQQDTPSVVLGPQGERVAATSEKGRLTMTMADRTGTRTLLSVTTTEPSRTKVLVAGGHTPAVTADEGSSEPGR